MTPAHAQLSTLFRELYPPLCRFLAVLLGDAALAKDLAQEAFARLHRHGACRIPAGEARFWLFRVARNLALNERKQRRLHARPAAIPLGAAGIAALTVESVQRDRPADLVAVRLDLFGARPAHGMATVALGGTTSFALAHGAQLQLRLSLAPGEDAR